jgi:hypothetical protein
MSVRKVSASATIKKGAVSAPPPRVQSASSKKNTSYLDYYKSNCNSLDARTFTGIRKQVIKYIADEKCPPEVRILFADWLFRKIYRAYKLPSSDKGDVCENLSPAIEQCNVLTAKGEYLGFHDTEAVTNLSLRFYIQRFSQKDKYFVLQMLNDVQLVKNIVQDPDITDEGMKKHFIEWLKSSSVHEQQSNLLDVLLRYYPRDPDVQQIYLKMKYGKKGKGTIYEDAQNVHDEEIQQGVLEAVGKLLEWDEKIGPIEIPPETAFKDFAVFLLNKYCKTPKEKEVARCVIDRMCIDHTSFPTTVNGIKRSFGISDVFMALMNYMDKSPHTNDLISPLNEELLAMSELCSTGYPTHFINVLRGFDPRFEVSISFEKQLYAIVSYAIQSKMTQDTPEEIIMGAYEEEHRTSYVNFVRDIVNNLIPVWNEDYGEDDIKSHLATVLQSFTMLSGWRLSNENRIYYEFDPSGELSVGNLEITSAPSEESSGDGFEML